MTKPQVSAAIPCSVGREFGLFTVVQQASASKGDLRRWRLRCRGCGTTRVASWGSLRRHGVKCGKCEADRKRSRAFAPGDRVGMLEVVGANGRTRRQRVLYDVVCTKCGERSTRTSVSLANEVYGGCIKCGKDNLRVRLETAAREYGELEARLAPLLVGPGVTSLHGAGKKPMATLRQIAAVRLSAAGYTTPQIGDILGVNHTSVLRALQDYTLEDLIDRVVLSTGVVRDVVVATIAGEAEATDFDRAEVDGDGRWAYRLMVDTLRSMDSQTDREEAWRRYCRRTWPWSWERQMAQMPRGVDVAPG